MKRPVITIGQSSYRYTRTPQGENSCELCDLLDYCLNRGDKYNNLECLTFDSPGDWHLVKVTESNEKN